MGFTITVLVEASILILNAFAVLNEERFLRKIGWAMPAGDSVDNLQPPSSVKGKLIQVLHAIRLVARVPLIAVNALVIGLLLVFG